MSRAQDAQERQKSPKPFSPAPSPANPTGPLIASVASAGPSKGHPAPAGGRARFPLAPVRAGLRLGRHSVRRKADKLPNPRGARCAGATFGYPHPMCSGSTSAAGSWMNRSGFGSTEGAKKGCKPTRSALLCPHSQGRLLKGLAGFGNCRFAAQHNWMLC